jgi:hypothetical protein
MTDPAIRNFVGLAENQWDFTAPEFVPGFGALELTPAVRRMVAELIASARDETASPPDPDLQGVDQELQNPAEMRPIAIHRATDAVARGAGQAASGRGAQASDADLWQPSVRSSIIDAATQRRSDEALEESKPARRRHGSALPK